jgi:class 3 adenylate cyclase/ketosteroid isomerase-like protein
VKADAETEAAVIAVLNGILEAYGNRDLDRLLGFFVPDSDLVFFGSGEDEKRIGPAALRAHFERDWSQSDSMYFGLDWISVSVVGSVAWAAFDATLQGVVGGQNVCYPARFTAVLEHRGDRWLCAHWHGSFPAFTQPAGEAWPTPIDAVVASVQAERPDLRRHAAPDGTVTILFTDIEGSTEMTERLGDLRWLDLLREHNAIVRQQMTDNEGFEVKAEGDGFMLAFQSARRGLHCAVGIQRMFACRNDEAEEPIHVRIGLHTGEAIKEAEDFFGKHVVLASRIASEARGGQILVSSLLKELTESAGDIRFGEGREVELKGLAGRHRLHEVVWD